MAEFTAPDASHSGYSAVFRAAALAEDLDDFNHFTSQVDVGRIVKHGAKADIDPITGEKKSGRDTAYQRSLDWLLANDLVYAERYNIVWQAVDETLDETARVIDDLLEQRAVAQTALNDILADAPTLPDGRKVFRDATGQVRDESGTRVDDDIAVVIEWQGNEPSYEAYRAAQDRLTTVDHSVNEARGIEAELGGLRGQLTERDTPPSAEGLDKIERQGSILRDRLDEIGTSFALHAQDVMQPDAEPRELGAVNPISMPTGGLSIDLGTKP